MFDRHMFSELIFDPGNHSNQFDPQFVPEVNMPYTSETIVIEGVKVKIATGTYGNGKPGKTQTVNVYDSSDTDGNYRERYRINNEDHKVTPAEIATHAKTLKELDAFLVNQKGATRLPLEHKIERIPDLLLSDGRQIILRRISSDQLCTDLNFEGTRRRPVVVEVVKVQGKPIQPTRLVIGDSHSIWRSHQVDVIPANSTNPASITGLSATEAAAALRLFLSLVNNNDDGSGKCSTGTSQDERAGRISGPLIWIGAHAGTVVSGVLIAVITAIILTWLGLRP